MTPKQEVFAQAIASGMNASEAYRRSYAVGPGTKAATIHRQAFGLMQNGPVTARIAELREPVVVLVGFTLEKHLQDLATLRNAAAQRGQFATAIAAEKARGRHSGVAILKSEVAGPNCPPPQKNDMDDLNKLTKAELRTYLALKQKAIGHSDLNG